MFKNIQILLAFIGLVVIVAHGSIIHHHHDDEHSESSLVEHHHDSDDDSDDDHHFPIPTHQHIATSDLFEFARTSNNSFVNIDKLLNCCQATIRDLLFIPEIEPPNRTYQSSISDWIDPLPFVISPDATRGSPSIA